MVKMKSFQKGYRVMNEKNEQFFEEIYDSTNIKILKYISARCGNIQDIEDLVQEVYLDFFHLIKRKGVSNIDSVDAFLITIAKKKLAKYYKKIKKHNECSLDESIMNDNDLLERITVSLPEEDIINRLTIDKIWNIIERESDLTLKIFKLKYIKNMTFAQIAKETGETETILNKYYRTITKLKNHFINSEKEKNVKNGTK